MDFLPHETLEERKRLILKKETMQQFGYNPETLGRHSGQKVVFKCIVCAQPHQATHKMLLDRKGLSHAGECRKLFRSAGSQRARQNEDPKNKEIRAQKLREKMQKDGKKVVAKRQKTLIKKYGSKKLSEIPVISDKISLGVRRAHSEKGGQIVKQRQETNQERYGSANFLTSEEGVAVVQAASQRLFGTNYPFQNKEHRLKAIEYQTRFLEDGSPAYDYIDNHPHQKYINRYLAYQVLDNDGETAFKEFCGKLPAHTNLEHYSSKLFNAPFFNRFVCSALRYKPDFKVGEVYVNVDGLYWHSELEKQNNYHSKLRISFEQAGLQILQFREHEIYQKSEIVKSIVCAKLNKFESRFYARNCVVKKVLRADASMFLANNHLMGDYKSATAYGLYSDNQLLMLISIRQIQSDKLEIARLCTRTNTCITGGFSKLLSHVEKKYNPKMIVSYCDLRYATGHSYESNGFTRVSVSQGWEWTDFNTTYNRLRCRANMDDRRLSQAEQAAELGWYKIYDAGQAKYVKIV